jgi:DNA-binding NarL/FixJ family response regulator
MPNPLDRLSTRKRDIARLVVNGRHNWQIAGELVPPCAEETVKRHLHEIYLQLGISGRTELAVLWATYGGE